MLLHLWGVVKYAALPISYNATGSIVSVALNKTRLLLLALFRTLKVLMKFYGDSKMTELKKEDICKKNKKIKNTKEKSSSFIIVSYSVTKTKAVDLNKCSFARKLMSK